MGVKLSTTRATRDRAVQPGCTAAAGVRTIAVNPWRHGLTLIESLIAATVLSIVATSALLPFTAGASHALAAIRLQKATAYAQAMMEEVLARPFYGPDGTTNPPGPDTAFEDRRQRYDDLDDFNGFTEQVTGMRDYINQPITDPDATGLWRDVTITYVSFPGQQAADTNSYILVRVRVWDGDALLATLHRLVAREY